MGLVIILVLLNRSLLLIQEAMSLSYTDGRKLLLYEPADQTKLGLS